MADAVSLEGLEFEISATTRDAIQNLDSLSQSLKNLKKSVDTNINSSIDKFKELNKAISAVSENSPIHKLAESLEKLSEVSKLPKFKMPDNLGKTISDSFKGFEPDSVKKVSEAIGEFNASATSEAFKQFSEISKALNEMSTDSSSAENLGKIVSQIKSLSSVGTIDSSIATELKRVSEAINSTNKVNTFKIQNLSSLLENMKQNPSVSWLTEYINNLAQALKDYPVETSDAVVTELKKFEFQSNFETIKSLANNINTLTTNVSALNTSLATASSGGLQVFENSAAGISKLNSAISSLDENALNDKITAVDKVFQREFSQKLANSVQGFPDIKLSSIADALGKMKGLDLYISETFVDNLSLLSGVMRDEWDGNDILKLYSLAEALEPFKGISEVTIPKGFTTFLSNLSDKLSNFDATNLPALFKVAEALRGFIGLGNIKISSSFANQIGKISDALKKLTEKDIKKLRELADAVKKIGEVGDKSLKLKINTSDVSKAKNNFDTLKQSIIGTSPIAKIATSTFKNMFLAPLKYAGKLSVAIGKSILSPIQKVASRLKVVIAGFGKIIKLRAFRFIITSITGGIKEGTDNLYQFSKGINGEFAKSMDTLATSMLYFKNSVGAVLAPIINQLAPAIDLLVDKIVDGTNKINQFLAQMTGATYWTKAVKYPKEYAEAVDDAKKSVQDFTMGFDELNIISDNSSSKSSDNLDYSKMFEIVDLEKDPWTEQLKNSIESGDWYGAGTLLGEKFNSIFQNIDYSGAGAELGTKINNAISLAKGFLDVSDFETIGTGIASFLNSGFDKIDFYNLGSVLAGKWNILIDTVHGFVTEFKFAEFGKDLSDTVNGWFDTIDLNKAVDDLSLGLQGILDLTSSFLENTNFSEFGNKVGGALNKFIDDLPTIVSKFASAAGDFASGVFDFLSGTIEGIDWKDSGEKLFDAIKNLFTDVDWGKVTSSFAEFLGSAIGGSIALFTGFAGEATDAYSNLYDWLSSGNVDSGQQFVDWGEENVVRPLLKGIVSGMYGSSAWDDFEDVINESGGMYGFLEGWGADVIDRFFIAIDKIKTKVEEKAKDIIEGLKTGLLWKDIDKFLKEKIFSPFVSAFKDLFGIHSPSTVMKEQGAFLIAGLKNGITDTWKSLKEWVKQHIFDPFITGFKTLFGINSPSTVMKELGGYIISGLKSGITGGWSSLKEWVSSHIYNPFITAFKSIFGISSPSKVMKEQGEYITEGLKEGIETPTDKLKESSEKAIDAVKSPFYSISNFFKDTFSDAWGKVKEVFSDGGDVFVGFETGISEIFKNLVNGLIDGINSIMSNSFNKINEGFWALRLWSFDGGYPFYELLPNIEVPEIPKFAKGGFPNSGDLFFANENGRPEFVGSMGGRTAVANNDQITEGIYEAVYSAMMAVMSNQGNDGSTEINLYLDSKQIAAKIEERRLARGQQIFTGGVVNEY